MYSFSANAQVVEQADFSKFVPQDYVITDTIYGDLNKDGKTDCALIVKGTDPSNFVINRYDENVDRNRRGIILLLQTKNQYELVLKNMDCFTSENEDGGVYFPPELSVFIRKGNLYVNYSHGRYGYWTYTFRYQHGRFELIGYDQTNGGVVIEKETSINFSTKKKQTKVNTNENAQGGDEVFEEKWETLTVDRLVQLAEITDFFEIDLSQYMK